MADDTSSHIWIPDEKQEWILADIVHKDGNSIFVNINGVQKSVAFESCHSFDETHGLYLDDVAKLNNLSEAPLLDLLRRRFQKDDIYTFVSLLPFPFPFSPPLLPLSLPLCFTHMLSILRKRFCWRLFLFCQVYKRCCCCYEPIQETSCPLWDAEQ